MLSLVSGADKVPERVGVGSLLIAPSARSPVTGALLSFTPVISAVVVAVVVSKIMLRPAEKGPWLPASSTMQALNITKVASAVATTGVDGVKDQVVPEVVAVPSRVGVPLMPMVAYTCSSSPLDRAADSVPESVGVVSSVRAPSARLPVISPLLSLTAVIVASWVGLSVSTVSSHGLEEAPGLPTALLTTAAVREWLPSASNGLVNDQVRSLTAAVPSRRPLSKIHTISPSASTADRVPFRAGVASLVMAPWASGPAAGSSWSLTPVIAAVVPGAWLSITSS